MAEFNPQFSTPEAPLYLKLSQAGSTPQPIAPVGNTVVNKSSQYALEGIGNAIAGGAELVDSTVKGVIKNQLEDEIRGKQDDFIKQLDSYQNANSTPKTISNPMDANASATDQDLMPNQPAIPQDIKNGIKVAANIQNAKDQGGKVRTTGLDANLLELQKDMRSKFPGYRDYIDQHMSSITGYNVANKIISDKISEINEQRSNAQRQQEYWEKQITSSGYDGSTAVLDQFRRDGDVTKVEHWYAKNTEAQARVDRAIKGYQLSNAQDADQKNKARTALTEAATHAATNIYANNNLIEGQTDSPTSRDLEKKIYDLAAHPEMRDDKATDILAGQYEALHQRNLSQVTQLMRSLVNKDGKNVYQTLGPEEYNKIIDDIVTTPYKVNQKLITDKDYGLLKSTNRDIGYIKDTATLNVLKDAGGVGSIARTAAALNAIGPNMFSAQLAENIYATQPNLVNDLLKLNGIQKKQAMAQTGGTGPNGEYTFGQSKGEINQAKAIANSSPEVEGKAYKDLIGLHQALLEKNPQVVDNAITYFYHPSNLGSLNGFMDDYYDNVKGQVMRGRTGAFEDLTGPGVTKAIWKRYKEGNTSAWDNYKGWALDEASKNLTNIAASWSQNAKEMQNNRHEWSPISLQRMFKAETPPLTNFHYYYDSDEHKLGLMNNKGEIVQDKDFALGQSALMHIRNANKYFQSLARIAHEEGTNPDQLIFATMQKAWPLDTEGQKIFRAIASSYVKMPKPEKEEEK